MEKQSNQKALLFYVAIAYGITWFCWIAAFLLGYKEVSFSSFINGELISTRQKILFFIFRLGVYGPLLASFLMTFYLAGKRGIKKLWERIINWQVGIKWYSYALLLPVVINLVVVGIGLVMGLPIKSFFKAEVPLNLIAVYFLYQLLTSGLEEPGWRGFALQKLQANYNAEQASWILGLIWAVWHFPYVIYLYSGSGLMVIIFSLLGFSLAIIAQTFITTWLYNNTRSVLIAIIYHAWSNTATTYILGNITIVNPLLGTIPALVSWGVVFGLLKIYGGETLKG